jgi:hypothetical protein
LNTAFKASNDICGFNSAMFNLQGFKQD